jgi:hypothetical protein
MKHILDTGEMRELLSDDGSGGWSKEKYLVKYKNQKYALRRCKNQSFADYYSKIHRKLKKHGFLPKLLYSEDIDLVFEYIEGRDCVKADADSVAYRVGKICGLTNQIRKDEVYDLDSKFFKAAKYLIDKKVIEKEKYSKLKNRYYELRPKKLTFKTDIRDINPDNFRLKGDKIYLVDLEAIETNLKGGCFAKAYIRWFKTPEQRQKFKEGYGSVMSTKFLTNQYVQFLLLNYLIINTCSKIRRGKSYSKLRKERINILIRGRSI